MSAKKRIGRPRLPVGRAKKPFSMRFSDAEIVTFEAKAKAAKLSLREWITATLTDAAK